MGIELSQVSAHWNYFLCLEDDVDELARWIELSEANFNCYSVELARLLMTASAEVDVVARAICEKLSPDRNADNIHSYQELLTEEFPDIWQATVDIPRYGVKLRPWANWEEKRSPPLWWTANNKVKHHRSVHFNQATLKNVLNAVGGLLHLLIIYHGELGAKFESTPRLFLTNSFCLSIGGTIMYMPKKR